MNLFQNPGLPTVPVPTRRGDRPKQPVPPVIDPATVLFQQQAGPLNGPAGYGVVNGAPYGQNLQAELGALQDRYRLQPGVYARLRAATKKALGR